MSEALGVFLALTYLKKTGFQNYMSKLLLSVLCYLNINCSLPTELTALFTNLTIQNWQSDNWKVTMETFVFSLLDCSFNLTNKTTAPVIRRLKYTKLTDFKYILDKNTYFIDLYNLPHLNKWSVTIVTGL